MASATEAFAPIITIGNPGQSCSSAFIRSMPLVSGSVSSLSTTRAGARSRSSIASAPVTARET